MTEPSMSEEFAEALRSELVQRANSKSRRGRRALLGGGFAVAILFSGTAIAAATGLISLPGATTTTPLSETKTMTHQGTGTLDLGQRPVDATGVALSLTCLTSGSLTFDDGASVACTLPADQDQHTTYVLPITSVKNDFVTIATRDDDMWWTLSASWVSAETGDWALNIAGQTYGVVNSKGEPDLIAVVSMDGRPGYVSRTDLEGANGTAEAREFVSPEDATDWQAVHVGTVRHIPVYESDGVTRIGEFAVMIG